ncbi:MAG: hypothetical protein WC683_06830 [bacterium]
MRRYMACAWGPGLWRVGYALGANVWNVIHPIPDVRNFDTYEEADQVALRVSRGEFGHEVGVYVSMR